jgi:hypothetical protein
MNQMERYARAQKAERDAWKDVRLSLPGSPTFDERKWATWQAAIDQVAQVMDARRGSQRQSAAERTPRAR